MRNITRHFNAYIFALFGLLTWLCLGLSAEAATYYVGKSGSDSHSCTQAQNSATAKKTIVAGAKCLSGGDTLIIGGGTYAEMINNAFSISGSANNPTTIKASPGEKVWIQPNRSTGAVMTFQDSTKYVIIDGINVDQSLHNPNDGKHHGIVIYNDQHNSHITIQNCEVKNVTGASGIVVGDTSENITIRNCHIHDIKTYKDGADGRWGNCLYTRPRRNAIFEDNILGPCGALGISLFSGDGSPVENNIIRRNLIKGNDGGITTGNSATNNMIYNNIIVDSSKDGIKTYSGNNKFYNNTIYKSGRNGVQNLSGSNRNIFRNNIIFANSNNISDAGSGNIFEDNLHSNPLFADAAKGDFRLQAGSSAIDKGQTLTDVPDDFSKVPRPQGARYDIGAYEFSSSTNGSLQPPVNLRVDSVGR